MDMDQTIAAQRESAALWLLFDHANLGTLGADRLGLVEADFLIDEHRQVFRWICDGTLTPEHIVWAIRAKVWPPHVAAAVNNMLACYGLNAACETAVAQVRDAGRLRRLQGAIGLELKRLDLESSDVAPLVTLLQQLDSVRRRGTIQPTALHAVSDLCRDHPDLAEPIIGGLLRRGEVLNIVGSAKTGKSWLLHDLLISLATGQPWLDRFLCKPSKVVLVDNELHPATLAHRMRDVASARGVPTDLLDRLLVISHRGKLADIFTVISEVERACSGQPPHIVAIDALYRTLPAGASENDNAAITAVYNALDGLAQRTGAAVLCVHHTSKGEQAGKSVTDVGSGAGAQSRAADTHLVLRPHEEEGCVVLDAAIRSFSPVQPCVLRLAHPVWRIDETLDAAKLRQPAKPRPPQQTVTDGEVTDLVAYVGSEGCLHSTILAIAERQGMSRRKASAILSEAVERGELHREREAFGGVIRYTRNGQAVHIHAEPPI